VFLDAEAVFADRDGFSRIELKQRDGNRTMLFVALFLSGLLLLLVNWTAFKAKSPFKGILWLCVGFAIGPIFLMTIAKMVLIQALLIVVAAAIWHKSKRGPASFLKLSSGATVIGYAITGFMVYENMRHYERIRRRFPLESMEIRVPPPRGVSGSKPLSFDSENRLVGLENTRRYGMGPHEWGLKRLHEDTVRLFISNPGFGLSRMDAWWLGDVSRLSSYGNPPPVPAQPGTSLRTRWSPGALDPVPDAETSLGPLLDESIVDFANPFSFGYFKDRRHVAGFEPHQFSEVPKPPEQWKLQTVELVSLLLHDEPVVYVSDRLPSMNHADDLPTRPLNEFEDFGLHALRNGDDLFTSQEVGGVRMLGAIRSAMQCVACHGGARGDLLGAFSYRLQTDPSPLRISSESP
jgi:hypothetical protein